MEGWVVNPTDLVMRFMLEAKDSILSLSMKSDGSEEQNVSGRKDLENSRILKKRYT